MARAASSGQRMSGQVLPLQGAPRAVVRLPSLPFSYGIGTVLQKVARTFASRYPH